MNNNLPQGTFIVGNKLMGVCVDCEKIIRIDKPIFGSMHICLTHEEKEQKRIAKSMLNEQKKYMNSLGNIGSNLAK